MTYSRVRDDVIEFSSSFFPHAVATGARARGCFTCTHFHGNLFCTHVLCERNGGRSVVGVPIQGCAYWEREPGSDDDCA